MNDPATYLEDRTRCVADLQAYFTPAEGFTSKDAFSGGMFERLGGGGDRPDVKNVFTADDLVAVSLLAIRLGHRKEIGRAVIALLDERRAEFEHLLGEIPVGVDLADERAEPLIADGGPADVLWQQLEALPQFGWVTACKLMARKRPALIPVFDTVIQAALQPEKGCYWVSLHEVLRRGLDDRLSDLRAAAGLPETISTIRVLDVVIWMREGRSWPSDAADSAES